MPFSRDRRASSSKMMSFAAILLLLHSLELAIASTPGRRVLTNCTSPPAGSGNPESGLRGLRDKGAGSAHRDLAAHPVAHPVRERGVEPAPEFEGALRREGPAGGLARVQDHVLRPALRVRR